MTQIWRGVYLIISIAFLIYLALPSSVFPAPSEYSLQSKEPADTETDLRRGYYNNETRPEVIAYYKKVFNESLFLGSNINIFSIRLNYPPEESKTIIRDQTRSTYLEEIVHPFRQSLFINGFEPKRDSEMIVVDGNKYKQKIIILLVNSNPITRMIIGMFTEILLYLNILLWLNLIKSYTKPT